MNRYMVIGRPRPEADWSQGAALLAREQAHIAQLRTEGTALHLFIQEGRSAVFLILQAASEAGLHRVLDSLPMHAHLSFEVVALDADPGQF